MTWICDKCYSEMEVKHVGPDENRVSCPKCGETWYVDDDDEYINDSGSDCGEGYCRVCEHNEEYPDCVSKCPYDED